MFFIYLLVSIHMLLILVYLSKRAPCYINRKKKQKPCNINYFKSTVMVQHHTEQWTVACNYRIMGYLFLGLWCWTEETDPGSILWSWCQGQRAEVKGWRVVQSEARGHGTGWTDSVGIVHPVLQRSTLHYQILKPGYRPYL